MFSIHYILENKNKYNKILLKLTYTLNNLCIKKADTYKEKLISTK